MQMEIERLRKAEGLSDVCKRRKNCFGTDRLVSLMVDFLEKHAVDYAGRENQGFSLKNLEEEFHYSAFYMNRIFMEEKGSTIYQYVKKRRLENAAEKLRHTEKTIIEIGYEAGYQSQQAFTRAFHTYFKKSPYEYRTYVEAAA